MRQVNLVRKQEFDYLRSVQKRQAGEVAEPTLAGLPASLPRAGKVRGDTLKKIDEIEAQLDLLWVSSRNKPTDSQFSHGAALADHGTPSQFSSTFLAGPGVLTQMMHHSEMPASVLLVQSLEDHGAKSASAAADGGLIGREAVRLAPMSNTTGMDAQDEVLIKAAELFCAADYELAAQHLARSLRGKEMRSGHALRRLLALLDIYRATGNQAQFDWSVLEYFDFWDGRTPQWQRRIGAPRDPNAALDKPAAPKASERKGESPVTRLWRCPSALNLAAADDLRAHWLRGGSCTIDWTSLSTIDADASALLRVVFTTEQCAPEQLVFLDTPNLLYVLEQATPIGMSEVDRNLWLLRFCMLALMGMRGAFDAACTDFCLTYIEPAPVWQGSNIQFIGDALATVPVAAAPVSDSPWYLHGHVLGESGLGLPEPRQGRINVDCATLVRMDPSATALLMQWLSKASSHGAQVHFNDVGLLVGAAWTAAGVDAFAHVHLRDVP